MYLESIIHFWCDVNMINDMNMNIYEYDKYDIKITIRG